MRENEQSTYVCNCLVSRLDFFPTILFFNKILCSRTIVFIAIKLSINLDNVTNLFERKFKWIRWNVYRFNVSDIKINFFENSERCSHVNILFFCLNFTIKGSKCVNTLLSKIELEIDGILLLTAVKTRPFCYFIYVLTAFNLNICHFNSDFTK